MVFYNLLYDSITMIRVMAIHAGSEHTAAWHPHDVSRPVYPWQLPKWSIFESSPDSLVSLIYTSHHGCQRRDLPPRIPPQILNPTSQLVYHLTLPALTMSPTPSKHQESISSSPTPSARPRSSPPCKKR